MNRGLGLVGAAAGVLLGCGVPALSELPAVPDPPLRDVTVELDGGIELHVAGAWFDRADEGRGVTALATAPGDPPVRVRADRTEWRLHDGEMTFFGGVRLERGDLLLLASELRVTLLEGEVARAVATGGVRVTRGDREGTAETVVLDLTRGTVELRDRATLREGGRRMTGARIAVDLEREVVTCDACEVVVDRPLPAPPASASGGAGAPPR